MLLQMLGFLRLSFIDVIDIILVALVIFEVFRRIRGSSAMNIFVAIIILLVVRLFAGAVGMKMISSLLGTVIDVGAVALIVIFQPEIRRFLNTMGRRAGNTLEKRNFLDKLISGGKKTVLSSTTVTEVAEACMEMSESKTGALILLRKGDSLKDIIDTGDIIEAAVTRRLIMNIFFKNSPLHDGAMIIGDDRIMAARCTLPITDRMNLPAHYGMRHKAAIGISEQSDVEVLVVSEETGAVSFVRGGEVTKVQNINDLKLLIGRTE